MIQKDAFRRIVVGALAVLAVVGAVQSLGDERKDKPFVPSARGDEPATPPPVGLQRGSLVLRGNLAPALRRLEARSPGGRVRMLRVAPDRVDVQVITTEGRLRNLQHRYTGETQMLADASADGVAIAGTFAWSAVDPSAPRRIVERAVRGGTSRDLKFLVLLDGDGKPRWSAFLAGGRRFTARADGRGVRPDGD